jgi:hypothetical protein
VQATLHVEGSAAQVNALINLAIDEGMCLDVQIEAHEPEPKVRAKPRPAPVLHFSPGDRVEVASYASRYNIAVGARGVVTAVLSHGRRSAIRVRWDDGHESRIGGSMVKVTEPTQPGVEAS